MMSKEIENLEEEIRAALQGLSEEEIFFLTEIGARVDSPSQAVRRVSPIVHLNPKEEEIVRKIARLKKMVLAKDQGADFPKILQDLRKPKESEMKDLPSEERVEKIREKMRARNEAEKKEVKEKREEKIKRFLILVVEEFEREVQSLESEIGLVPKLVKRFHTSLDDNEFDEVVGKLEKMGFVIEHFEKSLSGWMDVILYEKPKKRTGPGSSI